MRGHRVHIFLTKKTCARGEERALRKRLQNIYNSGLDSLPHREKQKNDYEPTIESDGVKPIK